LFTTFPHGSFAFVLVLNQTKEKETFFFVINFALTSLTKDFFFLSSVTFSIPKLYGFFMSYRYKYKNIGSLRKISFYSTELCVYKVIDNHTTISPDNDSIKQQHHHHLLKQRMSERKIANQKNEL
jgi:hypothetical protein